MMILALVYLGVLLSLLGYINLRKKPLDSFERVVLSVASVFWPITVPYLLITALVMWMLEMRKKKS